VYAQITNDHISRRRQNIGSILARLGCGRFRGALYCISFSGIDTFDFSGLRSDRLHQRVASELYCASSVPLVLRDVSVGRRCWLLLFSVYQTGARRRPTDPDVAAGVIHCSSNRWRIGGSLDSLAEAPIWQGAAASSHCSLRS